MEPRSIDRIFWDAAQLEPSGERDAYLARACAGDEWFFLAMAQWRQGHKGEARAAYDRGVAWMAKHHPEHLQLRRFRAEAARLLGVKDEKAKQ